VAQVEGMNKWARWVPSWIDCQRAKDMKNDNEIPEIVKDPRCLET